MRTTIATALLIGCFAGEASGAERPTPRPQTVKDDTAIRAIFEADQTDRTGDAIRREPEAVLCRDRDRRDAMLAHLKSGRLRTARDHFHAAMVFQHSREDLDLAHALATIASTLDPEPKEYRWLMAAAWDRQLMQHLQPQWYGTQYQTDDVGTFLYPVAEGAVSDTERAAMGVPPLAEARRMQDEFNRSAGNPPRKSVPSIADLKAKGHAARMTQLPSHCPED